LRAITFAAGLNLLAAPPRHPAASATVTQRVKTATAGTHIAINGPRELAVDSAGSLYITNTGAGDILVYNSSFVQQPARTIVNGQWTPGGVAVDPFGNVFVSYPFENTYGQVNEYQSSGTLLSTISLANSNPQIFGPTYLAVDALDDLYVVNSAYSTLSVFQKSGVLDYSANLAAVSGNTYTSSVAIVGSELFANVGRGGSPGAAATSGLTAFDADSLVSGHLKGRLGIGIGANSWINGVSADAYGNLWSTDAANNTIIQTDDPLGSPLAFTLLRLNYVPGGIAVDPARGYMYVSDFSSNKIHVYTIDGIPVAIIT
jgi:DNA-binding beta-propeller fold protein YncE